MPRRSVLPSRRRPLFADLPRRAYLTVRYHGWSTLLLRIATSPLRLVGMERGVRAWTERRAENRRARRWYRRHGRPVTVVVPTYGPPEMTLEAVRRLRRTIDSARTRIVVVDDGSSPEHQERLREVRGAETVLVPENAGFAASVNRGLERAGAGDDAVVLNNDVVAHPYWLERLQRTAYDEDVTGVAGPKLVYADGRIQSAGSYRNLTEPEWFDHRYRFKPADHGPAEVPADVLAVTGACMYLRRDVIDQVGRFDEAYGMAYEDVDYCVRAWEAGRSVAYEPGSVLTHVESPTRGMEVRERERTSQTRFWERWGTWFDGRSVRTPEGALRVVYVTEDTGVGGGHRDVFEHLNRLRDRGHDVALYSLDGPPDWFDLHAPVRAFETYEELAAGLAGEEAIKVATWWATSPWVWRASVSRGIPAYFVQDFETSYYPDSQRMRDRVVASYREEFRYLTISRWNQERLAEVGREARLVPPGVDLDTFRPLDSVARRDDVVLAIGRSNPLKDLPLTVDGWRALDGAAELWMFGNEPQLGEANGARYVTSPSDAGVNELMNEASVFVQTSRHEGFCLPLLEAMAAGTPVVSTDAHGNRDFCRHEENCLVVDADRHSVAEGLRRVLGDAQLRERLVREGIKTAEEYRWDRRVAEVERALEEIADDPAYGRLAAQPSAV